MKKKIVLASTSRYRALLLDRLQLAYQVHAPTLTELPQPGETPAETALRLAAAKAENVAPHFPDALIIGSDQVLDCEGIQLGKPGTRERARAQLRMLRGKSVVFHTAVALHNAATSTTSQRVVPTRVSLRPYSDAAIENYLDREDALDCAGSAKSEGLGAALIASMTSDDPTALVGLPLLALIDMLAAEGVEILA